MKLENGSMRLLALGMFLGAVGAAAADGRRLTSPDGAVQAEVSVDPAGQLVYTVSFHGRVVIAESPVGLTLNGLDLGKVGTLTSLSVREAQERYPARGAHAQAGFDALQALYNVKPLIGPAYGMQVTAANDGFAWRFLVPGDGTRRVNAETACWRLAEGEFKTYAGAELLPPVAELPEERGYARVTEAALSGYGGLRLQAQTNGTVQGVFAEKEGFALEGRIVTPWRVVLLARDLNALVNSDLAASLNPPPDPELFGTFDWMTGGRSVWSGGPAAAGPVTVEEEKRMIDGAARLTFEFTTLAPGWEARSNAWEVLKAVCAYGKTKQVRVFAGKRASELALPENRYQALRLFLDRVRDAGAAGVTLAGADGSDAGAVALAEQAAREAATRNLLVAFDGGWKPAGTSRTYPNALVDEGPRGLFGCAEGQPAAFARPGELTWAHQVATAYLGTAPLRVFAGQPQALLDEPRMAPVVAFLQTLPVVWDETRVLAGSRIGELAVFARRSGRVWYVAMANGTSDLKLVSFSPGFTGWSQARLTRIADVFGQAQDFAFSTRMVSGVASVIVTLEPHGGFVAKLEQE